MDFLEPYSELFLDYGGHDFAAGFGIEQEKLTKFLESLKQFSGSMEFENDADSETLTIDAELPHDYLKPEILNLVDKFEPYGCNSPALTFMTKRVKILNANIIGKAEPLHLRFNLECGKYKWNALYWKAAEKLGTEFKVGDYADIVFNVSKNYFNGTVTPKMVIKDLKKIDYVN